MAEQASRPMDTAAEVRESIEAKATPNNGRVNNNHQAQAKDAHAFAANDASASVYANANPPSSVGTKVDGDGDGNADAEAEAEADAEGELEEETQVPERLDNQMLNVIENIANYLSTYKEEDGYKIADRFQRIPNRRLIPDYHEVIKEPVAFSTIRTKKMKKQYTTFSEFVRDVALISHNAQVYNRPSSDFFQDAVRLREVFKEELQKLVEDETITAEEAILPDLGEIPDMEDSPPPDPDDEDAEDDDEDDEDEDDDDDDSDDDGGRRRGRRGRRTSTAGRRSDMRDDDARKRRGRPPKVLTPLEARIHSLLKGLRKFKHSDNELFIAPFERLPDKQATPDYFATIKNPIAMDLIKRKAKRKKYQNLDQVLQDIELMFENAKEYNEEDSQIYKDAVELQSQARVLAEQEKAKPDNEFVDEDGRRPLPEIVHNGEVWKVGDWVHITNGNDLPKPIIAQIFRTWEDRSGQKWVNACWYYRPEQTVHRFDKHFLENEVVKTGQYRDHRIDEVVDRCFVMFVTRYNKGRPRGLPADKDVYVCEARYNEEKHKLNKIKTWASCLPDEVRDKDYEMDLFDVPRRLKKNPSPIKHLLQHDAKPTDDLPKPAWGAANAPPLVGAVHCREREPNDSPPPEPSPSPHPASVIEPSRRPSMLQASRSIDSPGDTMMGNTSHFSSMAPVPVPTPTPNPAGTYTPHFAPRPSPTPVPVPQYGNHGGAGVHSGYQAGTGHAPPQMPPTPHYQPHQQPHQPAQAYNGYPSQYSATPVPVPHQPHHLPPQQMNSPMPGYDTSQQRLAPSPVRNSIAPMPSPGVHQQANVWNPPRPVEVYQLDDAMNAKIPEHVREQFQRDESGRVLFFTQPPLDRAHPGLANESASLGHSVRYLADRAREVSDRRAKRKARDELRKEEEKKHRESEEEAAKREKLMMIDLAGDMFASWVDSMKKENDLVKQAYDGWSVRDDEIDRVSR
ncbi:hypothetical protein F4778DRAFT_770478 [Xylariomycetidae sp. FL2044]|nr:hypothetical protein F4778DRAFT_770478 [Xylariomycetidae sp. FL2044]